MKPCLLISEDHHTSLRLEDMLVWIGQPNAWHSGGREVELTVLSAWGLPEYISVCVCVFGDLGSNLTSDRVKASVAPCVFHCLHLSFYVCVNVCMCMFQSLWHGSVSSRLANFAQNLPDAECDTTCGVLSSLFALGRRWACTTGTVTPSTICGITPVTRCRIALTANDPWERVSVRLWS